MVRCVDVDLVPSAIERMATLQRSEIRDQRESRMSKVQLAARRAREGDAEDAERVQSRHLASSRAETLREPKVMS
jgi:hypothetical protein